jgi:hypothetical protein
MADPTWKLNGAALTTATTKGATIEVMGYRIGVPETLYGNKHIESLDADIENGDPALGPRDQWAVYLKVNCAPVSGANVDQKLMDVWQELTTRFNPISLGVVKLEATRQDNASANVIRHLLVQLATPYSYTPRTSEPSDDLETPGAYAGAGGHIVWPLRGACVFPWWVRASLLDQDTTPATAEVDTAAGADTVTINNPGDRWVGVKLAVKTGSVTSSPTGAQFTNTTTGDVLVINRSGGAFANGDYLDWFASDPRKRSRSSTNVRVRGQGDKLRIAPGNNTISGIRSAGTGSVTWLLTWPSFHFTF